VDGTWITGQDYTIPREVAEGTYDDSGTAHAPVVSPTITGPASGSHTIVWYGISRDGTAMETTGSPSASVTV
jgi:hypothetical protein